MQGGTGQGKPDRSEYRVRPGLKMGWGKMDVYWSNGFCSHFQSFYSLEL